MTLARVREQSLTLISIALRWLKAPWLAEIIPLLYAQMWPLPLFTYLLSQANGRICHLHPDCERANLNTLGLSPRVSATIQNARASSTQFL